MLENALVAGITSLGVDVLVIGPLPTPGVAYITRSLRADAGIVLSASHNAYEDNGIKFFRHDGYKLDDGVENQIEQLVFSGEIDSVRPTAGKIGRATRIDDALGRYVEFAKTSFPRSMSLEKMRIAVDVANGASYKSTPCILRELGADLQVFHNAPNGTNINRDCGSTHPEEIQRIVKETGVQVGITHDGDADRVLLCDENGEIVDGDEILAIAALDFLHAQRLRENTLVATVMSNFGLDETLAAAGGKVLRTKGRRSLRARRNDEARSERRRRAERPHDLSRLQHHGRRDCLRAADPPDHEDNRQAAERTEALPEEVSAGATQPARETKAATRRAP
jgi:phosphoglucosamine mutase